MNVTPRRLAAGLLTSAALGAAILGAAGCGGSASASTPAGGGAGTIPATGASANVDVTLGAPRELAMTTSVASVPAGAVTFHVRNAGTMTHEFVVIRSAKPAGALHVVHGAASEAGNVGETGDLSAGASKDLTLDLPAGHYALICNLPGHYAGGMHTDLTVE